MDGYDISELSQMVCYDCGNMFFILELPLGINNPCFCPYCGTEFESVIEVDNDINM